MIAAERILVRVPNWLGDLVMATPALRALRAGAPRAEITLHGRPALLSLLEASPWCDRLVPLRSYHRGPGSMWQEGFALRAHDFDLGLTLPDSWSAAFLLRVACRGRTVGYESPGRAVLLDRAVPAPPPLLPREDHALGLVRALGGAAEDTAVELRVASARAEEIEAWFAREGVRGADPLVLVAPGASYGAAKRWPPASFAACADALARRGCQVALIGSPEEKPLGRAVRDAMRADAWDWTGAFELGATAALVQRASLVICNDAGARHLAAALGVPCIALFGPTSVAKTARNLERVSVATSSVGCRPCYHRDCPTDHRCLRRITVQAVVRVAETRLVESGLPQGRGSVSGRAAAPEPGPRDASGSAA